jgi:hypothetical protein
MQIAASNDVFESQASSNVVSVKSVSTGAFSAPPDLVGGVANFLFDHGDVELIFVMVVPPGCPATDLRTPSNSTLWLSLP